MGLSTLPAVGTGESLGPTKRNRALQTPDATRDIDAGEWNAAAVALEGVCAEVGLSNGSTSGSLVARVTALEGAAAADGDVTGPEGATAGNIPTLDATGKILSDSGVAIGSIASAASAASAAQTDATQALSDAADAQATADAKADAFPTAPAVYTAATLTLADAYANYRARVSAASNAVAIQIPDTLTGGDSADATCFECTLIITDATTHAVTISTGEGLLTPVYMGSVSTITADNTLVAISVVRGVAYVAIVEPA